MTQPTANRFEKNPRLTIAFLGSLVTLALCLGAFFAVKAVRGEAKRGVERYIVLRERRPDSDIPQIPADTQVAVADGLEKRLTPSARTGMATSCPHRCIRSQTWLWSFGAAPPRNVCTCRRRSASPT